MRRAGWYRPAALAIGLVALLAMLPRGASAHSGYERSVPADGETVAASPPTVDVYFGQEMARSGGLPSLIVVNDSGDQVDLGATLDDADRTHITAELAPSLPEGRYTVIWHTISDEDGEEAQGAFHFFVGTPTGSGTPTPNPTLPDKGTPVPTPTAAATPAPSDDGGNDGAPYWLLAVGIAAALVVGGAAGLALGRRRSA